VSALAASVLAEFSGCDVLVNNAGIGAMGSPLYEVDPAKFDDVMATNLRGPYLMLRAFAPAMIAAGSGHIINIGSLAGKNPLPSGAAYAASKWGLLGLMLSAAEELRPHGVRVSVISPGSIATEFGGHAGQDDGWKISAEDVAAVVEEIVSQSPRSFISEVLLRPLHQAKA
jgi:3-oxoacyl-[acyl-carrier protein] reductase